MRKKYIVIAIVVWSLLALAAAYVLYNKPHRDVSDKQTEWRLLAVDLYGAFEKDERSANSRYIDRIIEVEGKVAAVQHTGVKTSLQLDAGSPGGGVNCSLSGSLPAEEVPAVGSTVVIKGKCTGFLMDVNLVDCIVKK